MNATWIEYHFPPSFYLSMNSLLLLASGVYEERADSTQAVDAREDRAGRAPHEGRSGPLLFRLSLLDLIDLPICPPTWGE